MLQNNKTVARFQIKTGMLTFAMISPLIFLLFFSLLLAAVVCLNL